MGVRYVLNPLHARRRNGYWIQVGPRKAVNWEGTTLVDRLRVGLPPGEARGESWIRQWLGMCFPGSSPGQLKSTVRALIRWKVLARANEAQSIPERFLRPALDFSAVVLERHRLESYRSGGPKSNTQRIGFGSSIFNPLRMNSVVFYSYLLIVATRLGFDYLIDYEGARRLRISLHKNGVVRDFSSRFRYFPEADKRGEDLAETKSFANYLCQQAGIAVPRQWPCRSLAEAYEFTGRFDFPVVVKPARGHSGMDVYANLSTKAMLREIVPMLLRKWSRRGGIVIEEHIPGNRYRLAVLGSEIVESRAALPPVIIGDGKHSIRELISIENRRRKREFTHAKGEAGIHLDARIRRYLRYQSYRPDSIVPNGKRLQLHYTLNRATRARSEAVPAGRIHPAVKEMAVKAVKLFGLHLAAVDYIAPNVSQPPRDSGGKICEVQAAPDIIPGDIDYEAFVEKVLRYSMSVEPEAPSARLSVRGVEGGLA